MGDTSTSTQYVGPNGHDAGTVSQWYDDHGEAIFTYVARRLGPEHARDVTADVFRSALEGQRRYDPVKGTALSWLYGIATNLIRRHWRTEQRRLRALDRLTDVEETVAGSADGVQRSIEQLDARRHLRSLLAVVETLPPPDRDLLILVAWEEKSHAEVGEILGIPTGTVASRLHRIRTQLRQEVGQA